MGWYFTNELCRATQIEWPFSRLKKFENFRSGDLHQALLLPRSLVDVVDALDLSAIHASCEAGDGRGQSAYASAMMVRVLLYGYATGVFSLCKIQARTYEDSALRFLSAGVVQQTTDNHPLAPMLEQVFGQIKEWRGFRRFSLLGLEKVRGEWNLV